MTEDLRTETIPTPQPARTRRRGGRTARVNPAIDLEAQPYVPMMDTSVPSPCVAVCAFDGGSFCQGCYRNQDEIREWMIMSREQKLAVLEAIAARRVAETGEQFW